MGFKESSAYCEYCKKDVLTRARTPNHILHLLLSIITGGLWLIIWLLLSSRPNHWRCAQCGRPIKKAAGYNYNSQVHFDGQNMWVKGKQNIKILEDKTILYVPTGAQWAGTPFFDSRQDLWKIELTGS